ncbi:MAG: ABC transporter ATP-binding protein [Bacteroidota bacterium]
MDIIKVENISKAYQLGQFNTGTLSNDLKRWWSLFRGKDDPFLKVGEENDRTVKGGSGLVWSLKDINFDIKQGDTVGIIGKNGAGKSTLLKLLSQITSPTSGSIRIRGRIASLLEVGTGFHPELSGRENIYLNGAILGMSKAEINSKFDEIVSFSGVEKYIDTPVKRYSSGMYVRLAFAVAAHLESDVLIVDEVLAVGDIDFQKKCLGKMDDISKGEGRTILFVSHNLPMLSSLCKTGIVLKNGKLTYEGSSAAAINFYQNGEGSGMGHISYLNEEVKPGDDIAEFHEAWLEDSAGNVRGEFDIRESIKVVMKFRLKKDLIQPFLPNFHFFDQFGQHIFISAPLSNEKVKSTENIYRVECQIPEYFFNTGYFSIGLAVTSTDLGVKVSFYEQNALNFTVTEDFARSVFRDGTSGGAFPGVIRPVLDWKINSL